MDTPPTSNMSNFTDSNSPLSNLTLKGTIPANVTYSWPPLEFLHVNFDLLTVQLRIVLSAIAIIIVSAHAAIRRPPSAAPSEEPALTGTSGKKRRKRKRELEPLVEGLQASDAIMFPLLAGVTLIGLYYLIKWLQDPAILNKILTGYLSLVSVMSLGKLFADGMGVLGDCVFPRVWSRRRRMCKVDPVERCHWELSTAGEEPELQRRKVEGLNGPFPAFGRWLYNTPARINMAWAVRRLVKEEWTVKLAAHGVGKGEFGVTLADAMGAVLALAVAVAYQFTGSSTLSNLMGAGLCYGALTIMSCTSFMIGTMVLVGLFFYDIVMVFYTPYMITVATKLDAPIKLTFQAGKAHTLLGLGDIVVPGIFICLALRFDLWRHYHHKIKYVPRTLAKTETSSAPISTETESPTRTITKTTEQKMQAVKPPYVSPSGRWGDYLWTARIPRDDAVLRLAAPGLAASSFPKPYFKACIAGYAAGMLATLVVMFIFKHGQPALLYLVPGVVGATWIMGAVRGELGELWMYTEDGSLDTEDVVVEVDGEGNVVGVVRVEEGEKKYEGKEGEKKDGEVVNQEKKVEDKNEKSVDADGAGEKEVTRGDSGHDVFLFSVRAPGDDELDEDDA